MKNLGLIFGGASLSTGIAASVLFGLNMIVWGALAAWLGSAMGFIGFGLILLALHPRAEYHADEHVVEDVPAVEIDIDMAVARAA